MRTNTKIASNAPRTHEGAVSVNVTAAKELRRTVMASMLFEDTFYENGVEAAARVADLVKRVPFAECAQIAIDAREKAKLRHVPLLIVREMIRTHRNVGKPMGDVIARVIQRPDEAGELIALYWKDGAEQPLTAQMKVGLARALKKFNEYQLSKWNRDGAVKLRDVAMLSHVRSGTVEEGRIHANLINKTFYPAATKSAKFPVKATYELGDEVTGLQTPDTWEVSLSEGGDKKATFERLMGENKLGALALLRNLRGMLEAGVSEDAIRTALGNMKAERVLPFRFITAAKYAPRLEDALEQAMFKCVAEQPKLLGKTALLIDHSGSMNASISAKSKLNRLEAGIGLAMILRECAERCRIFAFTDTFAELPPRRGFALAQGIRERMHWGGTYLGQAVRQLYAAYPDCERLIVITDEQSADRPPHPQGRGYVINVAGYQNGIAYGPWVSIDGWSEAVLDFIRVNEEEVES